MLKQIMLGVTIGLVFVSCKTPNAQTSETAATAAAAGGGWGACDKTAEELKNKETELREALRERLNLLRVLAEIGPNLATAVTAEAVNSGELPSEIAKLQGLGEPEAPTAEGNAKAKGLSIPSLYREIAQISLDIAKNVDPSAAKEMLAELASMAEDAKAKSSTATEATAKAELAAIRVTIQAAIAVIDVSHPMALTINSLGEILKGTGGPGLAVDIASAELLVAEAAKTNAKLNGLSAELFTKLTNVSSRNPEAIFVAQNQAAHASSVYCQTGCSNKQAGLIARTIGKIASYGKKNVPRADTSGLGEFVSRASVMEGGALRMADSEKTKEMEKRLKLSIESVGGETLEKSREVVKSGPRR